MIRRLVAVTAAFFLTVAVATAQGDSFSKNFKQFKDIAPGIDFFASVRSDVTAFEKPVAEARNKLSTYLGPELAKGAVVVCSSLEQRDSVNEARVLRMGYRWVLIQLTPAASSEQMLAQIRAQAGGQLPPGVMERLQNQTPEMKAAADARVVSATVQRMGYAILTTTLAPDKEFRASRLEDLGRSPLPDWLDIGITAQATGPGIPNLRFLQDRVDEAFPLEDLLTMSRPFVPPSAPGAGGGGFMIRMGGGGGGSGPGGAPGSAPGGGPGGGGRGGQMPKDVQDRMTFDAQAAGLFAYLVEKAGVEKTKELVRTARSGESPGELLLSALGSGDSLESLEKDWLTWLKEQKAESPGGMRFQMNQGRPQTPPQ